MRFTEMLDRKAEEIKQPPLAPAGTYLMRCKKHPEMAEVKGKDGTLYDRVDFELSIVAPVEVDEDALAEFGKIEGYTLRRNFLFNTSPEEKTAQERTLNNIKIFLTNLGCFEEGMTLQEGFAGCAGRECIGEVTHRPDPNDPERFYAEVNRTYAV
jgi:hypothetical protein